MNQPAKSSTRKADYAEVVAYATANPTMYQVAVATHFGISQCRVSHILTAAGIHGINRGRAPQPKPGHTNEQNEWEAILHGYGLGMERGLRLHSQRIVYGMDPHRMSQSATSATLTN